MGRASSKTWRYAKCENFIWETRRDEKTWRLGRKSDDLTKMSFRNTMKCDRNSCGSG